MSNATETASPTPSVDRWHVPPVCQGQMIEVSYGIDEDGNPWRRSYDRSDRTTIYMSGVMRDADWWEPWNAEPCNVAVEWDDEVPHTTAPPDGWAVYQLGDVASVWHYEPTDYNGDVQWSRPYPTRAAALAACCKDSER